MLIITMTSKFESHQYKILLMCDADYYNDKFICTTIQRMKLFSQS